MIEIDDAPEMEVIGVSKTVVIKRHAKAVFVFGGDDIKDFALAMLIGIVVGTYSSIFIASPVVIYWEQIFGRGPAADTAKVEDSGRRYISKKKRAKKADPEGEATA